ncbi:3-hydroxyisobutyrate dehydrogenase [Acrasis kona]|uniref:3-hydroxyisobutyrate dehydrogenase n=1 Tax=Acrasis kona TaxID=1008807 RepID=A0AAW2YYJ6_9EUKA
MKQFLPGTTRLGFIGTGVMGKSMLTHCINKGYVNPTIYTRTKEKAQPLIDLGAKFVETPREVAQNSDVIICIVGYPKDVRQVILDEKDGVISGIGKGSVIIDMTTSEPSLAREISEKAAEKGAHSLDAPVSGGDIGARNGTLTVMAGGEEEVFSAVQPLLASMGKALNYMGPAGNGQHTKMSNQILIATCMIGVVEGLLYAQKAGLDVEKVLTAVSAGAANSFSLQSYAPRILKRDFNPGFYVEHFVKDMGIALKESEEMGLNLPGLKLAKQLYDQLIEQGGAKYGTQALILALEKLNNIQ